MGMNHNRVVRWPLSVSRRHDLGEQQNSAPSRIESDALWPGDRAGQRQRMVMSNPVTIRANPMRKL